MAHQHMPYTMAYMPAPPTQYMMATHPGHSHTAHTHPHTYTHAHAQIHDGHAQGAVQMVSTTGPIRSEIAQRKRPKYTRSKTGCLTCRGKKIKCDEAKPNCTRCTNGQRDCVWPDPAPTKKQKSGPRKTLITDDTTSPSTESASRASGSATSRDATPNSRDQSQTQSPTIAEERRQSTGAMSSYSYLDNAAPLTRATPNGTAIHTPQGTPPLPSTAAAAVSYPPVSGGSYGFSNGSPNGSAYSPNNSRPSTANSAPPTHYNTSSMQAVDTRDYPRWEMTAPRTEAYATAYYA